jgi:hypothetical protein
LAVGGIVAVLRTKIIRGALVALVAAAMAVLAGSALADGGPRAGSGPAQWAAAKKKPGKGNAAARRLAALRAEAESLAKRVAALKAADTALASAPAPPTPAPIQQRIEAASGPAGGDLSGAYPEPRLAAHSVSAPSILANSVIADRIAPGSVRGQDFAPGSITSADVADRSIGVTQVQPESFDSTRLAETFRWPPAIRGPNVSITLAPGQHGRASVTCPNGTRLLSGGFFWKNLEGKRTEILNSSPGPGLQAFDTWEVVAKVQSGGAENTLTPVALCLE